MARPQFRPKYIPIAPYDEEAPERGHDGTTLLKFELSRARTEVNADSPFDPVADRRRGKKILALVGVGSIGALAALVYFAGIIAGAVALILLGILAAICNAALDETIELY